MTSRPRSAPFDLLLAAAGWLAVLLLVGAFGWLTFDVFRQGASQVSWGYLTTAPLDAGRAGGIGPILVSTALVLAVCLAVAMPIGIATAAWLSEFAPRATRRARLVRQSLDLLASVPSIVFGLFGMVFFCQWMGMGFSILAGGLTLSAMILPLVVQSTFVGFRAVPDDLRHAAAALGMRRVTVLRSLLLPAALPGIVVGLILGIGRAMAETAALIFTSGYVTRMPESLLDSGRTLSVHIFDLAMNVSGGNPRADAASFVLLAMLLAINLTAHSLAAVWRRG